MPTAIKGQEESHLPGFFTAMLQALQFAGADTCGLKKLSDADWKELLAFCDLAHLTLPLLRKYEAVAPAWVAARAKANLSDNHIRIQRIESAYVEIKTALEGAGIEHLVIKGFSQYPDFAEVQEDRLQSDIDLYCPPEGISAARAALTALGYQADRTLKNYPADHLPEMTRRRGWVWRGNMYDPDMPAAVDIHSCFWNQTGSRVSIAGVDGFWDRRISRHGNNFSYPALLGTDQLAFNALHVLRDLFRGDWVLQHVYELAWFLDTHVEDRKFWASWEADHDNSFRSLQIVSFWLARDWFGCRLAEALELEIATIPRPTLNWLHRFAKSPLTGMFRPNKHGAWLHLALLDSRRDKLLMLCAALLPFRLPAVGAPGQDASKTRRTRKFWPSQRYARYLLHVAFRGAFHLQTSLDALWHGLRLWFDHAT